MATARKSDNPFIENLMNTNPNPPGAQNDGDDAEAEATADRADKIRGEERRQPLVLDVSPATNGHTAIGAAQQTQPKSITLGNGFTVDVQELARLRERFTEGPEADHLEQTGVRVPIGMKRYVQEFIHSYNQDRPRRQQIDQQDIYLEALILFRAVYGLPPNSREGL